MSGLLRRAREFFTLAGSVRYLRKRNITNGQRQLQKLRDQIDELSQRLRSLETMAGAVGVDLGGPGPFRLPLLGQLTSLLTEVEDQLVMEFELGEGKQIYARIPCLAAAQLVNGDVSLPLQNLTVSPSTSIEFGGPPSSFRLPLLSRYEGHFYAGRDVRVAVFLTQESQRVYLPLSSDTYEKLLRQLEDALVPYRQSNVNEVGNELRFPYPLRHPMRGRR